MATEQGMFVCKGVERHGLCQRGSTPRSNLSCLKFLCYRNIDSRPLVCRVSTPGPELRASHEKRNRKRNVLTNENNNNVLQKHHPLTHHARKIMILFLTRMFSFEKKDIFGWGWGYFTGIPHPLFEAGHYRGKGTRPNVFLVGMTHFWRRGLPACQLYFAPEAGNETLREETENRGRAHALWSRCDQVSACSLLFDLWSWASHAGGRDGVVRTHFDDDSWENDP